MSYAKKSIAAVKAPQAPYALTDAPCEGEIVLVTLSLEPVLDDDGNLHGVKSVAEGVWCGADGTPKTLPDGSQVKRRHVHTLYGAVDRNAALADLLDGVKADHSDAGMRLAIQIAKALGVS